MIKFIHAEEVEACEVLASEQVAKYAACDLVARAGYELAAWRLENQRSL
jgi:hypothetical protein